MEHHIKELISQLTLEEKAGLCSGADHWHTKAVERLGIPAVKFSDGPHGVRAEDPHADRPYTFIPTICFPAACATAASFDVEALEQMGRALGRECQAVEVDTLLGPAVNIKRSPVCGRNFEYFSEDPYLTGKLASAYIHGVQSQGVGTSVKHFAANNQEYRRMGCSSDMTERTLREIYLSAFEECVKTQQPKTIMCSYNKINGDYAAEHKHLLTEVLRDEWGYEGIVVTDWGAVADRVKGVAAGLDLEMPGTGGMNDRYIVEAVKNGTLSEKDLDKAVENMLRFVFSCADSRREEQLDLERDHALAVNIAAESAVLLENNGVLPLGAGQKIAYIGGFAEAPRFQGGGSSHLTPSQSVSALEMARAKGRGVSYTMGFLVDEDTWNDADAAAAVENARQADVAVIFAGLPEAFESEGYDRTHMRLPDCQNRLIAEIAAVQPNTVVVLHNGSPVECPWAGDVAAVLEMYLSGQGGGEACDRLLWGESNPCGKLPETFPLKLEDNPSYLNFGGDGRNVRYAEGSYVGYRYYDTKKMPVRWAFGHGLSYTSFSYSNLRFSADTFADGQTICVQADITNTGKIAGKEIVQLYVADQNGTVGRPAKELKGFTKVSLAPNETKTVSFTLDPRSLSYYEEKINDWFAPTGNYEIIVSTSSDRKELSGKIRFETKRLLPLCVDDDTPLDVLDRDPRTHDAVQELIALIRRKIPMIPQTDDEDTAQEMGGDMEIPLKCFVIFEGYPREKMAALIEKLKELAG